MACGVVPWRGLKPAKRNRLAGTNQSDLGYLFIVTYGRSGSTLLQGLLNSIPGYIIRGENHAAMDELYRYHTKLVTERERFARGYRLPKTHAWYGIDGYRDRVAFDGIRKLMLETVIRPDDSTRVCGFKEIRWLADDLPSYIDFYANVFPGARFIINTRNLADVTKSKWWAEDPAAQEHLRHLESQFFQVHAALGDSSFHLHYDDYLEDSSILHELFAWLGETYDQQRIAKVLRRRHSY